MRFFLDCVHLLVEFVVRAADWSDGATPFVCSPNRHWCSGGLYALRGSALCNHSYFLVNPPPLASNHVIPTPSSSFLFVDSPSENLDQSISIANPHWLSSGFQDPRSASLSYSASAWKYASRVFLVQEY